MTRSRIALVLIAPLLLWSCASLPAGVATGAPVTLDEERGAQVAATVCAACHAIGPAGDSPSAFAPPFRNLRLRYNSIRLERHIADISATGVYGMPPQSLSTSDAEAVAAYIEHLRPAP